MTNKKNHDFFFFNGSRLFYMKMIKYVEGKSHLCLYFFGKVISFKYRGGWTCHIEMLMHSKMPFEQGK